jgi:hypothetical protein
MKESNIYQSLWQKYRPVILIKMRESAAGPCEYQLSKHEFEATGEKKKASYGFNLEIERGQAKNNIKGIAIARDLLEVLKSSATASTLMQERKYKINLGKDYKLKIQSFGPEAPAATVEAEPEAPTEE